MEKAEQIPAVKPATEIDDQTKEVCKSTDLSTANSEDKDQEEDEDMVLSEQGTEDLELGEILEKEGLDLNSIVEQWK